MPPCGELQQITVPDVVRVLGNWGIDRPEFGMLLGGDARGADGGLWIVLVEEREVVVLAPASGDQPPVDSCLRLGEMLPADPRLPGFAPRVDDLLRQVLRRGG
jgi:hypothetical protein